MKNIIEQVLKQQIDFTVCFGGELTTDVLAQKIADALVANSYGLQTEIGGPTEYARSAE